MINCPVVSSDLINLVIFMLYYLIRGVIYINIISKEHKMHFTTGSVIER